MAATGNEIVKLSQLKLLKDAAWTKIDTKMAKPATDGTAGQMLVANGDQTYRFVDVPEGTAYTADEVTLHLAGTQFSIKEGVIPTKVSELENDSKFQTDSQVSTAITEAVQTAVTGVYTVKGSVANQGALPQEENKTGDVYNVEDTGMNYVWNGTKWDALGSVTTLSTLGVTATATELNYVKGVTSGIQDQINGLKTVATTGANGMMSKEDKAKLDGIEANANHYVLPAATSGALGGVKSSAEVVVGGDGTMTIGTGINVSRFTNDAGYLTTIPVASDEDFKTYMGIAEG